MMRSLLYVPADSPRFIGKAHERGADAIILDLEDSVAPEHKSAARLGLGQSVASVGQAGAGVFVRINSSDEIQFADAIAACRAGADGLVIPKVQQPQHLDDLAYILSGIEAEMQRPAVQFIALIEDPGAVLNAAAIATAPRLIGLATGGEDLALSLGALPTPAVLHFPKLLVHYAAKAKGLLSLGLLRSVANYSDLEEIKLAVIEARDHGFDGATCIHPTIVPLLNVGFSPSDEELARANRVLDASKAHKGAFSLDGEMIDVPVIARARRILGRTN